uniref:Uncharacterized protein n=1 Tax=Glossina palpalis gambiensis TaxID=67801 RepID=A0A1B0B8A4_9MUSC
MILELLTLGTSLSISLGIERDTSKSPECKQESESFSLHPFSSVRYNDINHQFTSCSKKKEEKYITVSSKSLAAAKNNRRLVSGFIPIKSRFGLCLDLGPGKITSGSKPPRKSKIAKAASYCRNILISGNKLAFVIRSQLNIRKSTSILSRI